MPDYMAQENKKEITEEDFINPESLLSGPQWVQAFNEFSRIGFLNDQAVDLTTVLRKYKEENARGEAMKIFRRLQFQKWLREK